MCWNENGKNTCRVELRCCYFNTHNTQSNNCNRCKCTLKTCRLLKNMVWCTRNNVIGNCVIILLIERNSSSKNGWNVKMKRRWRLLNQWVTYYWAKCNAINHVSHVVNSADEFMLAGGVNEKNGVYSDAISDVYVLRFGQPTFHLISIAHRSMLRCQMFTNCVCWFARFALFRRKNTFFCTLNNGIFKSTANTDIWTRIKKDYFQKKRRNLSIVCFGIFSVRIKIS